MENEASGGICLDRVMKESGEGDRLMGRGVAYQELGEDRVLVEDWE